MAATAPHRSDWRRPLRHAASLVALALATPAAAAEAYYSEDLGAILMEGLLEQGDLARLKALYSAAPVKPDKLYINSPGGDFLAAIEAGTWVREMHLDTYAAGILCHSACGYLWLGGERRFANGIVTLHMPYYLTSGSTIAIPHEGIMEASWYLATLGYDKRLMEALLVVGTTEANPVFPITGPDTALFDIDYENFPDEGRFKDELRVLRSQSQ